jgi:hypothetical protein
MAKITHRYDLPDYAAFMNMGFELKLPDDVIKSVSDLADLVGAPTYIKTPVFPVREPGDFRSSSAASVSSSTGASGYHVVLELVRVVEAEAEAAAVIRLHEHRCLLVVWVLVKVQHRRAINKYRIVNGIRF